MTAQSTGAADIAFKGQKRYRISEHHKIMSSISTYSRNSIYNLDDSIQKYITALTA